MTLLKWLIVFNSIFLTRLFGIWQNVQIRIVTLDEIKGKLALCTCDIKEQISLSIDAVRSAPLMFTC